MLKQKVAQKIGNSRGARITAVPTMLCCSVLYCTVLFSAVLCLDDLHEFHMFPLSGLIVVWILIQYIFYIIELWAVNIIRIYLYML